VKPNQKGGMFLFICKKDADVKLKLDMKKISLKNVADILSEKEMKNVKGGTTGGCIAGACTDGTPCVWGSWEGGAQYWGYCRSNGSGGTGCSCEQF